MKKIAINVLKANPKAEKVFVTSDGMPFINKNAAMNHQRTLNLESKKDDKMQEFKASELLKVETPKTPEQ